MKIFKTAAIAVCLILFVLACNNDKLNPADIKTQNLKMEETAPPSPKQQPPVNEKEYKAEEIAENNLTDTIKSPRQTQQTLPVTKNNPGSTPDWNKKIIKNAFLNLEIKDFKIFNTTVREKIKLLGGYIATEEQNQSDYKIENIITVKVPVDQFDNAVTQFTGDVEKLVEKKITSEDVTSEVVDTKSRLEAKKQVRLRYLDLLKQAKNMEEILNVQTEINGIQEDIESAAGRIQYLGNASRFSTIHLTYFQVLNPSAKNIDEPGFATKLWTSFRKGWQWIGEVIIGIIAVWPLFLVVFACWILYRKSRIAKIKQA